MFTLMLTKTRKNMNLGILETSIFWISLIIFLCYLSSFENEKGIDFIKDKSYISPSFFYETVGERPSS